MRIPRFQRQPSVKKAKIINLSTKKELVCHFNPDHFEIGQSLNWSEDRTIGSDTPKLIFGGGQAQDMTITFLFDTTGYNGRRDVRSEYKVLTQMAKVDSKKKNAKTGLSEPPMCRFQWGKFLTFDAVITNLKQKFTFFTADGTPLRAEVTVTFKQVGKKLKPQNPTSRSEARKVWVVEEAQTLDWIAYQEYGDSAHWRHIAETNNLDDPEQLQPGQILKLTPLTD
ncbi:MAG TPA: peptidoglycan-binding protein [Anaerolineae bacterium]|nr:peptidoglycan-binding protein [Anaerolineae bacterium]HMR67648.1 peptidoglycan-binding protein [Anaerolineae bacterium]